MMYKAKHCLHEEINHGSTKDTKGKTLEIDCKSWIFLSNEDSPVPFYSEQSGRGPGREPLPNSHFLGQRCWVGTDSFPNPETRCGCTLCFSLHGQDMHPGSHFEINKSYVKWQSGMYIQFTTYLNIDWSIHICKQRSQLTTLIKYDGMFGVTF